MAKPKVVTFNSASLDGRVAASRDRLLLWGDERWQAMGESEEAYRWLRSLHQPQASLEGSGSLVRDEDEPAPLPPVRPPTRSPPTVDDSRGRAPAPPSRASPAGLRCE